MDGAPLRDVLLVVLGYVSGSMPMGVIVARLTGARDPRTVGSRRIGGTNSLRAMGARRALAVAVLDVAKGTVPVLAATVVGTDATVRALVGVAAVVGASHSVFLGFAGGRGLATGIGGMLAIQPLVVLVAAPAFFGVVGMTRYVSLASLVGAALAAVALGVCVALRLNAPGDLVFGTLGAGLVWLAHADSIGRLMRGEESRFRPGERGEAAR